MTTIKDVARLAGVSYTTVSHVLNNTRKVAPETADRVRQAVKALDFTPSAQARSLRSGASGLLGVITFESSSRYFDEVLEGMDEAAGENGLTLLILHADCGDEKEARAIDTCLSRGVDALVVDAYSGTSATLERLGRMDLPCIVLQSVAEAGKLEVMHTDDERGGSLAARHLLALGHREFALVSGDSCPAHSIVNRGKAFCGELERAGFPVRDECRMNGDFSLPGGYRSFERLMKLDPRPTGLFFYSDVMALGALRAARDMGIAVPDEVSIVGFDDIEDAGYSVPRLTSIRQPKRELGRMAVERIADRLKGVSRNVEPVKLQVELVARESTGRLVVA